MGMLKRQVRKALEKKCRERFYRLLQEENCTYDRFIRKEEESLPAPEEEGADPGIHFVEFSGEGEGPEWEETNQEILCFVEDVGQLRPQTAALLQQIFRENPTVGVVYGDEDEYNSNGKVRMNPWLKPAYSPDTLWSFFSFGSLVAVRRSRMAGIKLLGAGRRERIYSLFLQLSQDLKREEVFHVKRILSTGTKITYWGYEKEYEEIKRKLRGLRPRQKGEGVSVIIPSKDHPGLLEQCLKALAATAGGTEYEVVVVDNGSSEENREAIGKLRSLYGFQYLYHPMEFNFSAMCNLGAKHSSKDLLLFLNDDCQATEEGWMEKLMDQALLTHVGAVGAKLYYPEGNKLQHCGIYSLHLGPVHKLQFREDDRVYYDRRNRGIRNCLAVTAACLMVRKQVFRQAGGFTEELAVAFNDVDFCWRLYELGYFNCVHNEVSLIHHESLSRGADEGKEKLDRLMREKKLLYERHPKLWNRDPYYHPFFTDRILDVNYSFAYEYRGENPEVLAPRLMKKLPRRVRREVCVSPSVEYAGSVREWEPGKEGMPEGIYLQGCVFVIGSDNACFENYILLKNEKQQYYRVTPRRLYRPDLAVNVRDQVNADHGGFACRIEPKALPYGSYRIAFLVKDLCSGQYLLRETDRMIEHKDERRGELR